MDNNIQDPLLILEAHVCYMAAMGSEKKRDRLLKLIDPRWMQRAEVRNVFMQMQAAPADESLLMLVAPIMADAYMQAAINEPDVSATFAAEKLKEGYLSRNKAGLMQLLSAATTDKEYRKALDLFRKFVDTDTGDDRVEVVDMQHRSPSIEYTLQLGDIAFAPRREICAIKGRAKHGKTHLVAIMLAAMLSSGPVCGLERAEDNLRILYVDTEQSKWSSEHIVETSLRMAGLPTDKNCDRLTCINLRKTGKLRRKQVVEGYVATGSYDVVIVDGIKDLCLDFNDLKEADQLMVDVLAMVETYNVSYITVLHENPTGESSKMRGHLGTEVENKSFEVLQSKKSENGIFNITNTERRAKPLPTFAFKFNDDDELEACEPDEGKTTSPSPQATISKEEKQRNQFIKAFEDNYHLSLTQKEIIDNLAKKCDIKTTTAKRRIEYYEAKGLISCDDPNHGQGARYGLTPQTITEITTREYMEQAQSDEEPLTF